MTVWFVSRHPGAIAWAKNQKLKVDRWVEHLDTSEVSAGDVVLGTLPMGAAAEVCAKGAVFEALTFSPAFSERGKELATRDLERLDCRLVRYDIHALS